MWLTTSISGKKSVTAASDNTSFSLWGLKDFKVTHLMHLVVVHWGQRRRHFQEHKWKAKWTSAVASQDPPISSLYLCRSEQVPGSLPQSHRCPHHLGGRRSRGQGERKGFIVNTDYFPAAAQATSPTLPLISCRRTPHLITPLCCSTSLYTHPHLPTSNSHHILLLAATQNTQPTAISTLLHRQFFPKHNTHTLPLATQTCSL